MGNNKKTPRKPRQSLLQKFGSAKELVRFAELLLQEQSYRDIIRQMPGLSLTIGKVASYCRDHKGEITVAKLRYLERFDDKVPPEGASNIYSKQELAKLAPPPASRRPKKKKERELIVETVVVKQPARTTVVQSGGLPGEEEDRIVNDALTEWKPGDKRFRTGGAYAAMKVNQARIAAGIKTMTNAEEVLDKIKARLRAKNKK